MPVVIGPLSSVIPTPERHLPTYYRPTTPHNHQWQHIIINGNKDTKYTNRHLVKRPANLINASTVITYINITPLPTITKTNTIATPIHLVERRANLDTLLRGIDESDTIVLVEIDARRLKIGM